MSVWNYTCTDCTTTRRSRWRGCYQCETTTGTATTTPSFYSWGNTSGTVAATTQFVPTSPMPEGSIPVPVVVRTYTCTNTPHELVFDDGFSRVQVLQSGRLEPIYELGYGYIHDQTWEKLQGWRRFEDFAPLGEWIEVNKKQVKAWLKNMVKDPAYLRQQVLANIRHDILIELGTDINTHWHNMYPAVQDLKGDKIIGYVNKLIESLGKLTDEETALMLDEWKTAIGAIRRERKDMIKAHETSLKLLKKWLTTEEWKQIRENGQMAIPSKLDKNTIYIVKKDAKQMVEIFHGSKYSHKLCLHVSDQTLPVGDQLLAKILLLKTDEETFLKTANVHR